MHKIVRLPEVMKITGLARSTVYKKMAEKTFPQHISLGLKSVGWLETDVQDWILERITESSATLNN